MAEAAEEGAVQARVVRDVHGDVLKDSDAISVIMDLKSKGSLEHGIAAH